MVWSTIAYLVFSLYTHTFRSKGERTSSNKPFIHILRTTFHLTSLSHVGGPH
jgi:hypothetical protein